MVENDDGSEHFDALVERVTDLLRRDRRVSYRALKRRFTLDDDYLEDLKDELIKAKGVARDDDGAVLEWVDLENVPAVAASSAPGVAAWDAGERRQLTVMFCDLVGSTRLSGELDPEDLRRLIRDYQGVCCAIVARFEGYVAQLLGDGILIYFGYPAAHEDDARRAVLTGIEIVDAFLPGASPAASSRQLEVRIGVHTGPVVVGELEAGQRRERIALGETPNIAARVQGAAAPNTVVVSAATYALTARMFDCEALGPHDLKGLSAPLMLYRVRGLTAAAAHGDPRGRGATPLVGRVEEFALLRRLWLHAQEGAGQIVCLCGEAGIGKSRLVEELGSVVGAGRATRFTLRCSPYHRNSALYPFIAEIGQQLAFDALDGAERRLECLAQAIGGRRRVDDDTLPLLAGLLSVRAPESPALEALTAAERKRRLIANLVNWLVEEAEENTLFSVWEDLQWADPSTLEVLDALMTQVPTMRILLVLNFRPDFQLRWGNRAYINQITVGRLTRAEVAEMFGHRLGRDLPSPATIATISERTDGVPLFVEELAQSLREGGTGADALDRIPASLRDLLAARLDRLGSAREIAQIGAAFGREFSFALLRAVVALGSAEFEEGLTALVRAEILYQRGMPPSAHYRFKHALIRDAAYETLLKGTRREVHARIAQVLTRDFTDIAEAEPELVARHFGDAARAAEACEWWLRAGTRAAARSDYPEAIHHLEQGLSLIDTLPEGAARDTREIALYSALGPLMVATRGNAAREVGETYAKAVALARCEPDALVPFPLLLGLRSFHLVRGEVGKAHGLGTQLLDVAERDGETGLVLEAHLAVGNTAFIRGEYVDARRHFEQCVALFHPDQHGDHVLTYGLDPRLFALGRLTWTMWCLGDSAFATSTRGRILELAADSNHPYSVALTLLHAAWLCFHERDPECATRRADAALALAAQHAFPHLVGGAILCKGWAMVESGAIMEGISELRRGLAACAATGARLLMSFFPALLAMALGRAGEYREALELVDDALESGRRNGEHLYEAELQRLRGEFCLRGAGAQASPLTATAAFEHAIRIARDQQARAFELRATLALAELEAARGAPGTARSRLSRCCAQFPPDAATIDLARARTLLDEIS